MSITNINGVINPGIATVFCIKPDEVYQGEVLIKYAMKPVTLFKRGTYEEIRAQLKEQFPNCEVIPNGIYKCELDFIKLFGVKSSAQTWTGDEDVSMA